LKGRDFGRYGWAEGSGSCRSTSMSK